MPGSIFGYPRILGADEPNGVAPLTRVTAGLFCAATQVSKVSRSMNPSFEEELLCGSIVQFGILWMLLTDYYTFGLLFSRLCRRNCRDL